MCCMRCNSTFKIIIILLFYFIFIDIMFCPECGSTDKEMVGDICIDCFLKDFQMLELPKRIEVQICSHCNSKLEEGKWSDGTKTYADVDSNFGNEDEVNSNMAIAEIRVKATVPSEEILDKGELIKAIEAAKALAAEDYKDMTAVNEALAAAEEAVADTEATQEEVDAAAAALTSAMEALVKVEADWVPSEPNTSLYIRPFMFATEAFLEPAVMASLKSSKDISFPHFGHILNNNSPLFDIIPTSNHLVLLINLF